ncbi:protein TRC8 homolog [Ornithodoros turicata]|uniref:protein TRC8 homolog n=1 Tax=Ornithodoros turicata TaxID=34597 RepID=UPI003138FF22
MSLRGRVWALLDVALRVPPLFVMDALLGHGDEAEPHSSASWDAVLWGAIHLQALLVALAVSLLQTKQLVQAYLWLACAGAVLWSYAWNEAFARYATSLRGSSLIRELLRLDRGALQHTGANYAVQLSLAAGLACAQRLGTRGATALGLCLLAPTLATICSTPWAASPLAAAVAALAILAAAAVFRIAPAARRAFSWATAVVRHAGIPALLEHHWGRLHAPQVLRLFWTLRLAQCAMHLGGVSAFLRDPAEWAAQLLARGCDSPVALLGMAAMVALAGRAAGALAHSAAGLEGPPRRGLGTLAAVLFLVLALQTGLAGLEPQGRLARLYRNTCLLVTALLDALHARLAPTLIALAAAGGAPAARHARALALAIALAAAPCILVGTLWRNHGVSTWLLAVTAFGAELVIKVAVSLTLYLLFWTDARRPDALWERLDDYVYWVRATGSIAEFVCGVFLFLNGAWIFLFESRGTVRAFMMCFHAYFNIWAQGRAGWKACLRRRAAQRRLHALPEATSQQLRTLDDVCAICYQELRSARVTRCNHFFHGVCLRKWLYLQDLCPLCHASLQP